MADHGDGARLCGDEPRAEGARGSGSKRGLEAGAGCAFALADEADGIGEVGDAGDGLGVTGVAVAGPVAEVYARMWAFGEQLGGAAVVVDVFLRAETDEGIEFEVRAAECSVVDEDAVEVCLDAVAAEPCERYGAAAGEQVDGANLVEVAEGLSDTGDGAAEVEAEGVGGGGEPARGDARGPRWCGGVEEVRADAEVDAEGRIADDAVEVEGDEGARVSGHRAPRLIIPG